MQDSQLIYTQCEGEKIKKVKLYWLCVDIGVRKETPVSKTKTHG